MRKKSLIILLAMFIVSIGMILLFHSRAVSRGLRHTIVAEGNISHHGVRYFWQHGLQAYFTVVKSDAESHGRVRPMHWVHHHIPFVITLLRNGDLTYKDSEVRLSDRVNGCLQTHTYYQLFCVAIMLSALGFVLFRTTNTWWTGFLFISLAAGGGMCLRQNIIVNHCDSGEIGQMMYISLYLAAIIPALRGMLMSRWREVIAVFVLLLAYAMKETTVILLPAVGLALLVQLTPKIKYDREYLLFCVRHMLFHGVFASILLFYIWISRSGGYVSQNYEVKTDYMPSVTRAWALLELPSDLTTMLVVGGVLFFAAFFVWFRGRHGLKTSHTSPLLGLGYMFAILAFGFWGVNLPWQQISGKYFINAYVFICALVSLFVATPALLLKQHSFKYAYWLWIIGSVLFVARHLPEQREDVRRYYKEHYGYRNTAVAITENISNMLQNYDLNILRVEVVTRRMFPEGPLTFWRRLNWEHCLNIAYDGKPVAMIRTAERNYFRRYGGVPSVELRSFSQLENAKNADIVYFLGAPSEDETLMLQSAGFRESWSRQVGSPAIHILRYNREGLL